MSENISHRFDVIINKAKQIKKPLRVAIAGANSENILLGAVYAKREGFAEPLLLGSERKIKETMERIGIGPEEGLKIIPLTSDTNAVQYAIEMVNAGEADALMRGNTETRDFLMPILNKANHLIEPDHLLTHVVFIDVPDYPKLLAVSDITILVEPSPEKRKEVIKNLVYALKAFDVEHPNIALLSLVSKPSFHMRDSVEASTIVMDHKDEPIADCNLVGPIPYDLIISKEAARLKGYDNPLCGEFDGVVVPNLLAGNLITKVLQHSAHATSCGLIVGSRVPVAITSRSENAEQAYLSIAACAAVYLHHHQK